MQTIEVLLTGETKRNFFDFILDRHWYGEFENENDEPIGTPAARELRAAILSDAPAVDLAAPVVAHWWARFVAWRAAA